MKKWIVIFSMILSFTANLFAQEATNIPQKQKIGLCIVATGKYIKFVEPLVQSARKYFCPNQEVTYFVFSDSKIPESKDIVQIDQKRLGWPYDTLKRFHVYANNKDQLKNMDYIFAVDADMLFVDTVGEEILSDRTGIQHPGFVGKRGSYETNSQSTAYVSEKEGQYYFCGGFYGAKTKEFFKLLDTVIDHIETDLKQNRIAVWHDESHLNRYFIDNPPTKVLSPSYCYPESWKLPYAKKLLALDKQHSELRK
jgi:histo-blood group ABO system transferase